MTSASNEFETTILTGASLRVGIGSLFTCDSRLCCTAVLHVARYMQHVARSKLLADMDPSNGMAPSAGAPSVEVSCEPNM